MKTERAIEVLKDYNKWLNIPLGGDRIVTDDMPNIEEFQQALDKAIEVMGKEVTTNKWIDKMENATSIEDIQ